MAESDELTNFEKAIDGMTALAVAMKEYYAALIAAGFTNQEAMLMVVAYQHDLLTHKP